MFLSGKSKSTVGLDVGANSIKLVKLDHARGGYSVSAIGIRELPPEAIVADEIRDREAVIFNIEVGLEFPDHRFDVSRRRVVTNVNSELF